MQGEFYLSLSYQMVISFHRYNFTGTQATKENSVLMGKIKFLLIFTFNA
jgi:hypothetical protein